MGEDEGKRRLLESGKVSGKVSVSGRQGLIVVESGQVEEGEGSEG